MLKKITFLLLVSLLGLAACAAPAAASQPTDAADPTSAQAAGGNTASLTPVAASENTQPTAAETRLPRGNHPADWRDYPVVPEFSETAIQIYLRGVANGNDPQHFSKIGDCQNITTYFLSALEDPRFHSLGEEYAYLQETIDWYFGSYSRDSLAVAGGLNVGRLLSPLAANQQMCDPTENSLMCEVRHFNPSVVLVSLEENWNDRGAEEYGKHLRTIVDYLIAEGVVPILATKADNLEGDHSINAEIASVAAEYDLPLWNFWRAVQGLPNNGVEDDGFHLTVSGPYFDDPARMKSGWAWRNLTALQTLDAFRQAVTAAQGD
ncbi:MAG: SGNH/GDSL hydrolase family protein [Anaerolineales bacterium]|nr:SGNH/GDSL hydrolase family protein [Anaerolineales bacterium]MCW5854437.1 SGNH/GDSL hydrolase family protein [Anaerolineales bacterium]